MHHVLIIGAGKIGSLIALLLSKQPDYQVHLSDINIHTPALKHLAESNTRIRLTQLDATHPEQIQTFLQQHNIHAVVSSLPFFCNIHIAHAAHACKIHYFDLTEDVQTTNRITELAADATTAFVPQCGLAPGFINIAAHDLMQRFDSLDAVKLRVGALPLHVSNALQYSLSWSTDGLINEYGNLCHAIERGEEVKLLPLDDIEEIEVDGLIYEAFNTSGGIGSLVSTYAGKVNSLNYKTIRYPGHCAKMRFLMNDLKLNNDRPTLKRILENALPRIAQDMVLIYVSVTGMQQSVFTEESYIKKFYTETIDNTVWHAIQHTTASSICCVVDIVLTNPNHYHGLIKQEQFSLSAFLQNRFGNYYA